MKGRSKISLFRENITLYVEKPKESTKKLLKLIKKLSKVTEYKIGIQRITIFVHANHEQSKNEI